MPDMNTGSKDSLLVSYEPGAIPVLYKNQFGRDLR
jgi:hypothetical protein